MAIPVEMPKMSDTMEEGVLVAWMVEEGDSISAGDIIAQVETDKATMDLEVWEDGVLLKKVIADGDSVPIGDLIAVLGKEGEDISDLLAKYQGGGATTAPASDAAPATMPSGDGAQAAPATQATSAEAVGRLKVSPLARRLATEHGLDLAVIHGSGPEGRIIKRDIEAVLQSPVAVPSPVVEAPVVKAPIVEAPVALPPVVEPVVGGDGAPYESVRLSQMRKTIARRLAQSKYTAPHFYLTVDIAMERAIAVRKQLNEMAAEQGRGKVSFNDLITKACAVALRQHPYVNGSYLETEGEIRLHNHASIGIAVAIDEGLVTPVIRNADQKGLGQIAEETRALAGRARERKLQPDEMAGSTFTTSNLGMFGIEEFTAIINPPNACILAIGAIRDEAVVKNGELVAGKRMKVTLSCDHRVVDGATGAQFLQTVKQYLEEPLTLLL